MTIAVLKFVSERLANAGINYEFGEWNSDVVYPYFVGECAELEPFTEDGLLEADFTLNGFTRGKWIDLELAKATIESLFSNCTTILNNGSGVDISYGGYLIVPVENSELKRIQINLKVKEWRVNT